MWRLCATGRQRHSRLAATEGRGGAKSDAVPGVRGESIAPVKGRVTEAETAGTTALPTVRRETTVLG
jgi:hypothetical protein